MLLPVTPQEMLNDIITMERNLLTNQVDTFNGLEEANYYDLIEVLSEEGPEEKDEVIPLGYWLEDNLTSK